MPYHVMRTRILVMLVSLALAGPFPPAARAAALEATIEAKVDRFLARTFSASPTSGWSSLIVRINGNQLTAGQRKQIRSLGGYVYRHLYFVESVAVRMPNKNLRRLAALPFVRRLSADVSVTKSDEFTVAASGADIAFGQYRLTGAGLAVAVVDSGIRAAPDLNQGQKSRVRARVDFVTGGGAAAGPGDDPCGHGTHVAGIIAGNGAGSTGRNYYRTFYGIARKVDLIDVRVLGAAGEGAVSDVIKGIDWVLSNKAAYNIRVINLSLGHEVGEGYATDPLCRAVEKAWKAGVVVVCAAGNGGRLQPLRNPLVPDNEGHGTAYGSIQSPANSPYVITVGAMKSGRGDRDRDRIASYSGRGPSRLDFVLKPDLVAAGDQIISPNAPGSFLSDTFGGTNLVTWEEFCHAYDPADSAKYLRLSGTSMAAPVVSGAVALMLEAQPDLSPDTVKARLMLAADKWTFPDGGGADPCTFGAGYLNIPAALNNTAVATRHATSPALFRDLLGNVYIAVDTSDNGIWGTGVRDSHIMWGSGNPSTRGEMSSSGSVWGAGVWNDSAVWSAAGSRVDLSPVVIHGDAR